MALSEQSIVDKIEVIENGSVQVRTATVIKRDDKEISRNFHRHVLSPGSDLEGEDARVTAVANATGTPAVVAAYTESQKNNGVG